MKCYNLAIVEDEPHTARYIRKIVEDMGIYRITACVESAEELLGDESALELDLLITDIKMPGLSGIELVERLQKKVPRLVTVIISGYSSFDFARAAITLKVSRYLLKPIDREELVTVLLELYGQLSDLQEENQKNYIRQVYEQSRRILENPEEFPYPYIHALLVTGSGDRGSLILRCKTAFSLDRQEGCRVVCYRMGFAVLMRTGKAGAGGKLKEMAESICVWERASGNSALLVYTKEPWEGTDLRQKLLELYRFQEKNYIIGRASVKEYGETGAGKTSCEEDRFLVEKLQQNPYVKNTSTLAELLDRLFIRWKERSSSLYAMKLALYTLTIQFLSIAESKEELVAIMGNISQALYHAKTYEAAKENIQELLVPAVAGLMAASAGSQKQSQKMYLQITEFLSANVRQNYSLQEIGNLFSISQPYVSKLFRIYSGMSYKDYVTSLKINIAKEIMRDHKDVMIKDVADMVGYDQLYFSTVFHRITGEYPKHYREHLGE